MSEKKNNRRKGLAVALAVVGVAGLSLASASQFSLTTDSNLQAGVQDLADCQPVGDEIGVEFGSPTWTAGEFRVSSATLSGVDDACVGLDYTFVVLDGDTALATVTGEVPAGGTIATTFASQDAEAVDGFALTIYGDKA